MKKIKVEDRINNAIEAFFTINENKGNEFLAYTNNSSMLHVEENRDLVSNADRYYSLMKQVILFLPGVFILFQLTLSFFFFSMPFNGLMLFWILAGSFMTVAGVDDLKKSKSWLMPISIIVFTSLAAIPMFFMPENTRQDYFLGYSIYLFPFALMLPWIVKKSIGDK